MNFSGAVSLKKRTLCIIIALLILLFYYLFSSNGKWGLLGPDGDEGEVNLNLLLAAAIAAAQEGGREVKNSRENLVIGSKGLTREGLSDDVTSADYHSHCAMLRSLRILFPNLVTISEEATTNCDKIKLPTPIFDEAKIRILKDSLNLNGVKFAAMEEVRVWIDPLDATHEYTEKLYDYVTTMVCVSIAGTPFIGVIHNPFLNTTSWVGYGKHSLSPDLTSYEAKTKRRKNSNQFQNETLKIAVSRSHSGDIKNKLAKNLKNPHEIIIAAGAGYKSLLVAHGDVHAYLHTTIIKKWDTCAGDAIISKLNGKMYDKSYSPIQYFSRSNVENKGLIASIGDPYIYYKAIKD